MADFATELCNRLGINEGRKNTVYNDTMGIPTIGIGFNLQRGDADSALQQVGSSLAEVTAGTALTDDQVNQLFAYSIKDIVDQAETSLQPLHFDLLSDARRFVIVDLVFNMGLSGWMAFTNTRILLDSAIHEKHIGNADKAHQLFTQAAQHMTQSGWYSQVGDRAKRDVAMIRAGVWCSATGDGSDI